MKRGDIEAQRAEEALRERERRLQALEEQVRGEARRVETLTRTAARLNARLDLSAVLSAVCEETAHALDVAAATVSLYDAEREVICYAHGFGYPPELVQRARPTPRSVHDDLARQAGPLIVIPDLQRVPGLPDAALYAELGVRTCINADISHCGRLVGVLSAVTLRQVREFTQEELALLQGLADQAALAIANARLYEMERKTRRIAETFFQRIMTAREDERKQVSSVLHHDVGSLAVGIAARLDAIEEDLRSGKQGEALKWMKQTRELFGEAVGRLKEVAVQLRPPELDALGLRAALRQHFSRLTRHGAIRIHFTETLGRRRVSGATATTLFRVAQEALTNAITHGAAKRVDVGLRASKKGIELTVHDNGKGFNPSEHWDRETSQMGIRVMQEMVVLTGGTFAIDSGRGKGTTVRVRLPLKTAESAA